MGVYDELIETNPDDYEELVKPTTVSVNEFLDGEIDWKKNDFDISFARFIKYLEIPPNFCK